MIGISFSLVTIFILVVGGLVFFGAISTLMGHRKITNQITDQVFRQAREQSRDDQTSESQVSSDDYSCSKCGASLESGTEISPSGDFKCQYCNSWSNVHN